MNITKFNKLLELKILENDLKKLYKRKESLNNKISKIELKKLKLEKTLLNK